MDTRRRDRVFEDRVRAALEVLGQDKVSLPDGRTRGARKRGRDVTISLKTFPHIKKLILDMADAENTTFTEIFEDAIERRHREIDDPLMREIKLHNAKRKK